MCKTKHKSIARWLLIEDSMSVSAEGETTTVWSKLQFAGLESLSECVISCKTNENLDSSRFFQNNEFFFFFKRITHFRIAKKQFKMNNTSNADVKKTISNW